MQFDIREGVKLYMRSKRPHYVLKEHVASDRGVDVPIMADEDIFDVIDRVVEQGSEELTKIVQQCNEARWFDDYVDGEVINIPSSIEDTGSRQETRYEVNSNGSTARI